MLFMLNTGPILAKPISNSQIMMTRVYRPLRASVASIEPQTLPSIKGRYLARALNDSIVCKIVYWAERYQ